MEDQIQVTINMPLKNRIRQQEEFNKVLDNFQSYLQTNYGTSDIATATAMMVTEISAQIAINIATLGLGAIGDVGLEDVLNVELEPSTEILRTNLRGENEHLPWQNPIRGGVEIIPNLPSPIDIKNNQLIGLDPANPNMLQSLLESGKWEWAIQKAEEHARMLGISPTSDEALAYIKEIKKMWKLGSGR
jgi:hypothetical protein